MPETNADATDSTEGTQEFAEVADEESPVTESNEEAADTIAPDTSNELTNVAPPEENTDAGTQASNEEEENK
jgi:hypothetical protein